VVIIRILGKKIKFNEIFINSVLDSKQFEEGLLKEHFEVKNFSGVVEEKRIFKNLYKNYVINRNLMQNFTFSNNTINSTEFKNLKIEEDLKYTENLITATFRDFLALPELRRKNFYIENEINTSHQMNNFEFIYKQQDIYEYYDEIFRNKKNINLVGNETQINSIENLNIFQSDQLSKRDDLPFSALLNNFTEILYLFKKEDNIEEKMKLAKLRWYNLEENKYFKNIYFPSENQNPLNFILNSIFSKISIFCKFSYEYIKKYQNNNNNTTFQNSNSSDNINHILDQLLLDEYLKRSKSYFEAAKYLDEQLENLNVVVNYIYENEFKNYPCFPKFSFYRFMVIIWNKEVLTPLINTTDENLNILSKIQKMYKKYLESEIEVLEEQGKNFYDPTRFNYCSDLHLNLNLLHSNYEIKNYSSGFTSTNTSTHSYSTRNSMLSNHSYLSSDFNFEEKNKNSNFNDPQILKYFIEQIASSLLDMDCNEYSTFYINHSQMKISQKYHVMENLLSNTLEEVLRKHFSLSNINSNSNFSSTMKINLILNFLKDLGLDSHPSHPRLINRTRNLLLKTLCKICVDFSLEEITKIFDQYIRNNFDKLFSQEQIENFSFRNNFGQNNECLLHHFQEEKLNDEIKLIQEGLFNLAKEILNNKNENLARLLTINFIKEFPSENKNFQILKNLEEAMIHFHEDLERVKYLDKKITKETNRRNIPYNLSSNEEKFLKYESINFYQVEQIYLRHLKLDLSYMNLYSKGNSEDKKFFRGEKELDEISVNDGYSTAGSFSSSLQSPERIDNDIIMEVEYYL
jgi:hypothetical protein